MAQRVDLLPSTGNRPASIHGLQASHDPREIFADRQITAGQLLQGPYSLLPVIDRPEKIRPQQLGQLPGIDAVTLAAFFQQSIPAGVAHHDLRDVRLQQVVQPSRPGPFFKGDVQAPAQSLDKLENGAGLGFDDGFHHQLARRIQDRDRDRFLVNIQADILCAIHRGCSFLKGLRRTLQTYSKRGALLYCVGCNRIEFLEPLSGPGHPRLVNQGERSPAFAQGLNELRNEPILVPNFKGELVAFRQFLQEWPEPGKEIVHTHKRFLVEVAELEQQRSQLLAQKVHHFHELLELRLTIYQHFLVGDDLWNFCREHELFRRLARPSLYSRLRGGVVEGAVHFNRVEVLR